jgi:hypothetical protein
MNKSTAFILVLKQILSLVLCLALVFCISVQTYAVSKDRKEHDSNLECVLFDGGKYDKSKKDKVKMLEYASYLAIDQFNYKKTINKSGVDVGNGARELAYLKEKKVSKLPEKIEDIDFKASGNTHRTKTHRGWNFSYNTKEDRNRWKIRKTILCSTTNKVFGLSNKKGVPNSTCNNFSALVYYVHVLTDHTQDKWDKEKNKLTNQGLKMPLARANPGEGNEDIFLELENIINNLFKNQQDQKAFKKLTKEMDKLAKKARKLVDQKGGINSTERFEANQDYAKELLKLLKEYIPTLLKSEDFFQKAFY